MNDIAGPRPWEQGDDSQRWDGYLDTRYPDPEIGEYVLVNKVGATTYADLVQLEARHVSARQMTLVEAGLPHSYDLAGLCEIHAHLFQDVYPWAGELRTVDVGKGLPFARHQDIQAGWDQVAGILRETDLLRTVRPDAYTDMISRIYNAQNVLHPFREGNGRTNRVFTSALAAESGHRIDWATVPRHLNDRACEQGKAGDMSLLTDMFARITSRIDATTRQGAPADRGPMVPTPPGAAATRGALGARPYRPPHGPATPGKDLGR